MPSCNRNFRFLLAGLLTVAALPFQVFGQEVQPTRQNESELWRVRSQALTDDLVKDAGELSAMRRAVLWARLGQRWWAEDPRRARAWFSNAIDLVEQAPNEENAQEREERLRTARLMLTVVARLDLKLAERLVTVLTPDTKSVDERAANADSLIDTATTLLADEPERAASLTAIALRLGPRRDFSEILFYLRRNHPKLADSLFKQALDLARQDFSGSLLNSLTYAAFPAERGLGGSTPLPPEQLRVEVLRLLVSYINANPSNEQNHDSICASIGALVVPLLGAFDRLLPQQTPVVRQAINKCQAVAPLVQQQFASLQDQLNTVDDLLKAAADAKSDQIKTAYQFRAASLAKENKDYERALKILDGMTKVQREFMGESWESFHWDWTSKGALDYYEQGRLDEVNRLFNAIPPELQVFAKIAFLKRLPEADDSEPGPLVQILYDSLAELRRSKVPEADKYNWYFALLGPTMRFQPADADEVLKQAVLSLNQAKAEKTLDTAAFSDGVANPLLEMDEYIVKDRIAAIKVVETRAQLRLVLLEHTLIRMQAPRK